MERILVLAAHPDDETIGCGGSIARWSDEGHFVGAWFATDGVSARGVDAVAIERRKVAAQEALAILGVSVSVFARFPDNQLDQVSRLEVAKQMEGAIQDFRPTRIVTHSQADLNIDHRLVGECAAIAARPMPGSAIESIWHFEVPSSTGWFPNSTRTFSPTLYVDIDEYQDAKEEALLCYGAEIPRWPHGRSTDAMRALAAYRGSSVGLEAAEAFEVSRWILR